MNTNNDDSGSSGSDRRWWSRMLRREQLTAAIIGSVVTGIFAIIAALISSSAAADHASVSSAVGAASPSRVFSAVLASSSSAPATGSPAASSNATIAASSPASSPGQSTQNSSPSPNQQSNMQYLADLDSVSNLGFVETGNAELNGYNYLNSVVLEMSVGESFSVSYDAGRDWRFLEATVGLRDDSPQNQEYEFQVFADGSPIYSRLLVLGQSQYIKLNITGVLRIELRATITSPNYYGEAYGVWGDAELIN